MPSRVPDDAARAQPGARVVGRAGSRRSGVTGLTRGVRVGPRASESLPVAIISKSSCYYVTIICYYVSDIMCHNVL